MCFVNECPDPARPGWLLCEKHIQHYGLEDMAPREELGPAVSSTVSARDITIRDLQGEVARLRHVAHLAHALAMCPSYSVDQEKELTALMQALNALPPREFAAILEHGADASASTSQPGA